MPNKTELYHFTHSSPEIETVAELLANASSPAFLYNKEPNTFLAIVGEDNLTNRQRIEATFVLPEDIFYVGAAWDKLPLHPGTILYLEYEKVNQPSFLTEGIEVVSNDEPAFKAIRLAQLEADKGYISINKPIKGQVIKGGYQEILPDVTVWIWCRALSPKDDENFELKGEFFDLTPFVSNVTTNMTKNGGNFQITLPPLMCVQDKNNKWVLTKDSVDQYVNDNGASLQGTGYVAHSTMFTPQGEDEPLVRSQMLFHNIISSNDLILIRMETLELEKEQRYSDANELYVSKKNIAGRIYDMIGLVDSNILITNPANNDVSINVSGRDLAKIFIEDGTYFYALENSQGMLKFAGQSAQKNSLMSRIFADGGLNFIGLYQFTSIEYIMKFIMQQLSNIKIVPDDLFESYGTRRNKTFTDNGSAGIDNKKRDNLKSDAVTDIKSMRTKNSLQFTNEDLEANKVDEIFYTMGRFLQAIRTDGNRKTDASNSTQGWKSFVFEGEQIDDDSLPTYFTKNLFSTKNTADDIFYKFTNTVDKYIDAGTPDKKFKEQLAPGIWQIIKLVIDKTVANRRLADSSFSTANGSLLNFIRSACQEPLVEFYMDTYADEYNLIVRRPPYDQKGLISLIEGKVNTQTGLTETPPAIVNIQQDDVIKENLFYDDSSVYSWYHFFPKNAMVGSAEQYSLSYLGALYFPEYADIWGSKPFQQSHSYIPYIPLKNKNTTGLGLDEAQAVEDLKYVVESSQYLPFTRKGTLVVNRDRRLKIGNIFRYESTGEIGFITGVQHTFQITDAGIEATTTIHVERMMIEQLIYGQFLNEKDGDQPKFVSYFNIINTNLVYNKKTVTQQVTTSVKKPAVFKDVPVTTASNFLLNNFMQNSQIIQKGNVGMGFLEKYNAYPDNKNLFITFINGINKLGYRVRLCPLATNRTYIQQVALKKENPHNAAPGTSRHERGAAIDITIVNDKTGRVHSKTTDHDAWIATGVPALAKSLGLRWAAGDGKFGSYIDRVHFEIATTKTKVAVAPTESEYEDKTETITSVEIDREGIFQNFKVNKFAFNFFLKRRQNGEDFRKVTSRLVYDNGGALLNEVKVIGHKKNKK